MAFHTNNGLFFTRQADGTVCVEKRVPIINAREQYNGDFAIVERWQLDEASWASVLASMSARGESGETWQEARRFHARSCTCDGVRSCCSECP